MIRREAALPKRGLPRDLPFRDQAMRAFLAVANALKRLMGATRMRISAL